MEKYSCTIEMVRIQNNQSLLELVCKSNHFSHKKQRSSHKCTKIALSPVNFPLTLFCRYHFNATDETKCEFMKTEKEKESENGGTSHLCILSTKHRGYELVDLSWSPRMKQKSLDAVHGLELAQSLHRVDVLLLGGSLHSVGLAVVLLLSLHQRLLLRSFHPPGDCRHVEGLHAFAFLVFGGGHIGGLHSGNHGVHQVLCCLDEGHGAVQLDGRED